MFTNLHLHNTYSILDGLGTAEDYCKKAVELNQKSLALTNHGNVDGLIDFQKQCKKYNLKSILGCEAYIVPDLTVKQKEKRHHVTLLIKNQIGFRNLCKILTVANQDGFYYRPRIDYELLLNNCGGLVVMTACVGSFINISQGIDFFWKLYDKIGEDLYLEIMPHNQKLQVEVNNICRKLKRKELSLKYIATNDCHYINKEDEKTHEVLLAIKSKKKWDDKDRFKFSFSELYLKSYEEMKEAFKKQKQFKKSEYIEALLNTEEIAEKCSDFEIRSRKINLPKLYMEEYKDLSSDKILSKLCLVGRKQLFDNGEFTKEYKDRLKEELELISSKDFSQYFLIVHELVAWCKENDIMVGCGRGSVGGSLIAYLLNITAVDPIKFNLLFARFISQDRRDFPDIDLDFEDSKRHLVREHLIEIYGENNIAGISTFLKMKGKMAVRDVARVFEIPMAEVNEFCKVIEEDPLNAKGQSNLIRTAVEETNEGIRFNEKYPDIIRYAMKLEGLNRAVGQHAAAVVISNSDLRKGTRGNLVNRNNTSVINWDMEDCEYVGLMKLDLLGLNTLSILSEALNLIKRNYKKEIDINRLDLNNKKVLKNFSNGNTAGVFQFNTFGIKKLCKKLKITSFDDIVAINALYRPGTLRSGLVDTYVKRNNSKKSWKTVHEEMDKVTENTYGVIIYQEQLMKLVHKLAGMSWVEADKIRKVIAKSKGKKELHKFKDAFVKGCVEKKALTENEAEGLFETLEDFGGYAFNKSHSVAYSMIGYQCMYLKVYYPTEFICASLTHASEDKTEELVKEAYNFGLEVIPPKVGVSDSIKWIAKDNKIFAPFVEVKGIGEKTAIKLMEHKKPKVSMQKGFFKTSRTIASKKKKTKVEQILGDIKAYDLKDNNLDSSVINKYFSFNFKR